MSGVDNPYTSHKPPSHLSLSFCPLATLAVAQSMSEITISSQFPHALPQHLEDESCLFCDRAGPSEDKTSTVAPSYTPHVIRRCCRVGTEINPICCLPKLLRFTQHVRVLPCVCDLADRLGVNGFSCVWRMCCPEAPEAAPPWLWGGDVSGHREREGSDR